MSDTDKPTASALPLPFGRELGVYGSSSLPLPFTRLLGEIEDGGNASPPAEPNPWRDPARPMLSAPFGFALPRVSTKAAGISGFSDGLTFGFDIAGTASEAAAAAACMQAAAQGMEAVYGKQRSAWSGALQLAGKGAANISATADLRQEAAANISAGAPLAQCGRRQWGEPSALALTALQRISGAENKTHDLSVLAAASALTAKCAKSSSLPAVSVPCEWYEIPVEPDPPVNDNTYVCGLRPKSSRMPLRFMRLKVWHGAGMLPLPFACNPDLKTPVLKAYMLLNTVTASFDGQPIDLLSASFSSDMGGYCWQGSLTLPPDDFIRLNMDGRKKGAEALISVKINGELFSVLAEEYRDNREFGQKSYTVSGRSQTARLGESYAVQGSSVFDAPIYARQIADAQLKDTGIKLTAWQAADWLVPAGVYAATDKTPMAVLLELAQAAGAFVESHPADPAINIKPRWKKPAWEVAEAAPDVVVPSSVILKISGSRSVKPRANGVFVYADHGKGKGADVYRKSTDREPRASAVSGALYTDAPVLQAAGIAALSDTGTHKTETVTLPVSDKYALPRAEKGQIWQIQEPSGAWQGVVTGVTLSVEIENDAPRVLQTVVVNRYLDD